jgi:hypothetical protein
MEQQHERAARLFGAAEVLLEALHASLPHVERDDYGRAVAGVRAALGDAAFDTAHGEGRAMSVEEAIALALASQNPR